MFKIKRLLTLALLLLLLPLTPALAFPSQAEVEAAVRGNRFSEAEAMMREVIQAKPQSAKARYIYAEILAHNRQFDAALTQLKEAERLDPATSYAEPARIKAFEAQLEKARQQAHQPGSLSGTGAVIGAAPTAPDASPQTAATGNPAVRSETRAISNPVSRPAPAEEGTGWLSWVVLGGFLLGGVLLLRALFQRQRRLAAQPAPGYGGYTPGTPVGYPSGGYPQPGYGQGAYPPGAAPSAGGSALRTGLAAAGGFAAGMMVDRMLHGNEARAAEPSHERGADGLGSSQVVYGGGGGLDELERRPIDFGRGAGWDDGGDAAPDAGDGGGEGGGDGSGW